MDMISEFNVLSSQRVDKTDEKSKDFLNVNQIEFNFFFVFSNYVLFAFDLRQLVD